MFFGLLYLCILAWQDVRHKLMVDSRLNSFMMGVTVSLLSHYRTPWWYVTVLIVVAILIKVWIDKSGYFGQADGSSIMWMFLGWGIINTFLLGLFSIMLLLVSAGYIGLLRVMRKGHKWPFYPALAASFTLAVISAYNYY